MTPYFTPELLPPPRADGTFNPFWKRERAFVYNQPLVQFNADVRAFGGFKTIDCGMSSAEVSRALGVLNGDRYLLNYVEGTGTPILELKEQTNNGLWSLYQWFTVPKVALSCIAYKYSKFKVTRRIGCAQSKVKNYLDLRDQETVDLLNSLDTYSRSVDLFYKLGLTDVGLQRSGPLSNYDVTTYTYLPNFQPSEQEGIYSTAENPSAQTWLAWRPPEIITTGEEIPDLEERIATLFPYPSTPTQQQIDHVDKQRAWALRYAQRYDWATQFRAFDPAALRQGEIPDYGVPRQPAWEIPLDYAADTSDVRNVIQSYGDQFAMAWAPLDDANVRVLMRIRAETGLPVPDFTLADFGLPETFWMVEDQSTVTLVPRPQIGFEGTFRRVNAYLLLDPNQETLVVGRDQYFEPPTPPIETKQIDYALGQNVLDSSNGFCFDKISEISPDTSYSEEDTPTEVADAFANWGIIAPSVEACIAYALPIVELSGKFAYVIPPTTAPFPCVFRAVFKKTQTENGFEYRSTFIECKTEFGYPLPDLYPPLENLAEWFNDAFLNPSRYFEVGKMQWKHPDGKVMFEQPLFGHTWLFTQFDIDVECES